MQTNGALMKSKPTRRSIVKHFDGDFYTKYLSRIYEFTIKMTGWRTKVGKFALDGVKPCKMLDVGCGTGFILDIARKKGFEVHGIDPSEGMIKQAHTKYGFKANDIIQSKSDKLPFDDKTFDFVFASGSMMYIPNMKDTAAEITRVLKKGGTLRIIDHATPKKKTLFTAFVFLFIQASGHLIHDYDYYFSSHLKLIKHKTIGRGGYMQLFDFKKV